MDTATKTWLDAAKTTSRKVVQKTAEATCGFLGNKIAKKILKLDTNSRNVEEKDIPSEKITITVKGSNDANKRNKNLTFKNNAPFS